MSQAPTSTESITYFPDETTAEIIDFVKALEARGLSAPEARAALVGADSGRVELPESLHCVLLQVAEALIQDLAVTVAPQSDRLTTQAAAEFVGVSRPTLVRLLERGDIPMSKPGRHRYVQLSAWSPTRTPPGADGATSWTRWPTKPPPTASTTPPRASPRQDAFPDASVHGYEHLIDSLTCDPKDRHVLAAAAHAKCQVLVTFNLKDFPDASLDGLELSVVHPDEFLLDQFDLFPDRVLTALVEQVRTSATVVCRTARSAPPFWGEIRRGRSAQAPFRPTALGTPRLRPHTLVSRSPRPRQPRQHHQFLGHPLARPGLATTAANVTPKETAHHRGKGLHTTGPSSAKLDKDDGRRCRGRH